MRSRDTSPDAYRVQMDFYRRMTPGEKIELAMQMSEDMLHVAADGIRARHPDYDDDRVMWALRRLRLGDDELFASVWPGAPLVPS